MLGVTKASLLEREANYIGGDVNFVSKTVFRQNGRIIKFGLNFNLPSNNLDALSTTHRDIKGGSNTNKILPRAPIFTRTSSAFLAAKKPGGVLTFNNFDPFTFAHRLNRDLDNHAQPLNATRGGINYARISSWYLNDAAGRTHRKGYSVDLDYKLNPNTTAYFYTQANTSSLANRAPEFRLHGPDP